MYVVFPTSGDCDKEVGLLVWCPIPNACDKEEVGLLLMRFLTPDSCGKETSWQEREGVDPFAMGKKKDLIF